MKQQIKKIVSVAVLLTLIALAVRYFIENIAEFRELSLVNPVLLVPMGLLLLLNYFFIGFTLDVLMNSFGVRMGLKESFQLSIVTGFYNLITPFRGGLAARAIYLKKKHKFSYTEFFAILAASYVLIFLIAGIAGLISMFMIYQSTNQFSRIILSILLIFLVPLLLITILSPKFKETKYSWLNRFIRVVNGWHLIRGNKKVIFTTIIFSLLQLLSSALILYFAFRVFDIQVSYSAVLFIASLNTLGLLISITPAGLGITEAITVFSALTIGITATQSLSVAILGRLVQVVIMFVLGPIFSYKLLKNTKENEKNT